VPKTFHKVLALERSAFLKLLGRKRAIERGDRQLSPINLSDVVHAQQIIASCAGSKLTFRAALPTFSQRIRTVARSE
jgi:hypothetical protein